MENSFECVPCDTEVLAILVRHQASSFDYSQRIAALCREYYRISIKDFSTLLIVTSFAIDNLKSKIFGWCLKKCLLGYDYQEHLNTIVVRTGGWKWIIFTSQQREIFQKQLTLEYRSLYEKRQKADEDRKAKKESKRLLSRHSFQDDSSKDPSCYCANPKIGPPRYGTCDCGAYDPT